MDEINYWVSGDQHYGHDNIRRLCNRPFDSLQEMNRVLINNHNAIVKPEDHIYFVGDFSFKIGKSQIIKILKQLNGKKFVILGNHDKHLAKRAETGIVVSPEIQSCVEYVVERANIIIKDESAPRGERIIILDHYAGRVWNKKHWGAWQLYGHSHGTLSEEPNALAIDVGVDAVAKRYSVDGVLRQEDYRPMSYEEIKVIMENKQNLPVDHHK